MKINRAKLFQPNPSGVAEAAQLLRSGGLIAFPTETVYGLGADATNNLAVAAIFAAKGRPQFNPLIIHFATLEGLQKHVLWSETAQMIAQAFWPGPLTMVLKRCQNSSISMLASAGLDTLAVRLPAHPLAQNFLKTVKVPVAAPSANPSGKISPTTAHHVMAGLENKIAGIIDGEHCSVGIESTIIDLSGETPTILRYGGVTYEEITESLPHKIDIDIGHSSSIKAPGQLSSHYAPRAQLRLNALQANANECLLGFGKMTCDLNLSKSGDLVEAAGNLFKSLHELDRFSPKNIAVAPIPDTGLGRAINDRLKRAAAPRS